MSVYFGNNSANYLSITSALGFAGTYPLMTLLAWVRLHASATGARDDVIGGGNNGSAATNSGIWFNGSATVANRRIRVKDGSNAAIDTAGFSVDTWYCVAWRKTGTSVWNAPIGSYATVGGSFVTSAGADVLGTNLPTTVTLGRGNMPGSTTGFYGYMAAFRFWNTNLSDGELAAELAATSVAPVKTANLRADWRFANGALGTDSSGNGYNLTENGTLTYDSAVPSSWSGVSGSLVSRTRSMNGGIGVGMAGGMTG